MDFKGGFIEIMGVFFVILGAINSSTRDGVAGLVRFSGWLEFYLGPAFWIDWIRYLGNNFETAFYLMIGFLFLMYRGRWFFGLLKKILPVKL